VFYFRLCLKLINMFNGSYLIYVICVCLRIVVSNAYCGVFLLCLSSFCVPYVARLIYLLLFNVRWLTTILAILLTRTLQTMHHVLGKRRQYGRRMTIVLINTRDNHLTSRSADTTSMLV